jgi:hypothetical protein
LVIQSFYLFGIAVLNFYLIRKFSNHVDIVIIS